jgi:hypothetical protein
VRKGRDREAAAGHRAVVVVGHGAAAGTGAGGLRRLVGRAHNEAAFLGGFGLVLAVVGPAGIVMVWAGVGNTPTRPCGVGDLLGMAFVYLILAWCFLMMFAAALVVLAMLAGV